MTKNGNRGIGLNFSDYLILEREKTYRSWDSLSDRATVHGCILIRRNLNDSHGLLVVDEKSERQRIRQQLRRVPSLKGDDNTCAVLATEALRASHFQMLEACQSCRWKITEAPWNSGSTKGDLRKQAAVTQGSGHNIHNRFGITSNVCAFCIQDKRRIYRRSRNINSVLTATWRHIRMHEEVGQISESS